MLPLFWQIIEYAVLCYLLVFCLFECVFSYVSSALSSQSHPEAFPGFKDLRASVGGGVDFF